MKMLRSFLFLFFVATLAASAQTKPASKTHAAAADWATPSEKTDYRTTPRYDETMAYIRRVAAAAPGQVKLEPFGKTGEGRTLWTVVVSRDGVFDPAAIHKADRPVVLIQNAIHAGEMDGKDASLALLRDMVITRTRAGLLEKAVIVIIPIYNADGHERVSAYNRINQNGPEKMGWRANGSNLNLNRDYLKADTPETRAFLKLWNKWLPDFFFDDHVTDGADYQYDITYGVDSGPDVYPPLAKWVRESLYPYVDKSCTAAGHVIAPFINLIDDTDPSKGISTGQSPPRFSNGYATIQNRPGMLVEMHMLKDYKTRVTGNYELLRTTIEVINRDAAQLVKMNRDNDAATIAMAKNGGRVVLLAEPTDKTAPFEYKGVRAKVAKSEVSGVSVVEYTGEKFTQTVPIQLQENMKVTRSVKMATAYVIPQQWEEVIEVLEDHGLTLKRATKAFTVEVGLYQCPTPKWQATPFEGRHTASLDSGDRMSDAGFLQRRTKDDTQSGELPRACTLETRKVEYPAGTVIVPMAQRTAKVAVHFLEPDGPDSAIGWGFFDPIFEQKEYGEGYVLEKLAKEMMAKDPKLKEEFEKRLANDKDFAANPYARLNFFYKRSPWWQELNGAYPVGRLESLDGVPVK